MATSKGKEFETCVSKSFKASFPEGTIDRIYDTEGKRKGVKNICDFIGFNFPHIFYLEAKSCKKNTFNLKKLTQYDKLVEKIGVKGAYTGVVIWFIDHKKVVYAGIELVKTLVENNVKSINIKKPETYSFELPTYTPRVYPIIDFSKKFNFL